MIDTQDFVAHWRSMAGKCNSFRTPAYLFSEEILYARIERYRRTLSELKCRAQPWYSLKTLPLRAAVACAVGVGFGVEVVSEEEYLAATSWFPHAPLLVNGPGKVRWLNKCLRSGIAIILDSEREIDWFADNKPAGNRIGVRLAPRYQYDPDDPAYRGQFGLRVDRIFGEKKLLCFFEESVQIAHFHLRSSVRNPLEFAIALDEICYKIESTMGIEKLHEMSFDIGGGLPDFSVSDADTGPYGDQDSYLRSFVDALNDVVMRYGIQELWLENGRFLTGPAGALLITVLDEKVQDEARYLICDGGRTNDATPSGWENHVVVPLADNGGHRQFTTVCGPTCMAYDWLARDQLPVGVGPGDRLLYLSAGAYHLSWESRFSRGPAGIGWLPREAGVLELRRPGLAEAWPENWI